MSLRKRYEVTPEGYEIWAVWNDMLAVFVSRVSDHESGWSFGVESIDPLYDGHKSGDCMYLEGEGFCNASFDRAAEFQRIYDGRRGIPFENDRDPCVRDFFIMLTRHHTMS